MTYLQALILGLVQGFTEFLPISSSAHLVLIPFIFQWSPQDGTSFVFNILIQLGTLVAVMVYFKEDVVSISQAWIESVVKPSEANRESFRFGLQIILATLPAALVGLFLKPRIESVFESPIMAGAFLIVTAILLFFAEKLKPGRLDIKALTWKAVVIIGLFQALALLPGISRSGATIFAGLMVGLKSKEAGRFSFLMSIPVMIGAGILSIGDLLQIKDLMAFIPLLLIGFTTAMIIGYLSIAVLMRFLHKYSLRYFSAYCVVLGSIIILMTYVA